MRSHIMHSALDDMCPIYIRTILISRTISYPRMNPSDKTVAVRVKSSLILGNIHISCISNIKLFSKTRTCKKLRDQREPRLLYEVIYLIENSIVVFISICHNTQIEFRICASRKCQICANCIFSKRIAWIDIKEWIIVTDHLDAHIHIERINDFMICDLIHCIRIPHFITEIHIKCFL